MFLLVLLLAGDPTAPVSANCDVFKMSVIDGAGAEQIDELDLGNGATVGQWKLDALQRFDVTVPANEAFAGWKFGNFFNCANTSDQCAADARMLKCNGSKLCPPGQDEFSLLGTKAIGRITKSQATLSALPGSLSSFRPEVRRAFASTIDGWMRLRDSLPTDRQLTSPFAHDNCKDEHSTFVQVVSREGWINALATAIRPLENHSFEGIALPQTDDLEVIVRRGEDSSAVRFVFGDLYDSANEDSDESFALYKKALANWRKNPASRDETPIWGVSRLGGWPGGKFPVRGVPRGQVWAPGELQTSAGEEPLHLSSEELGLTRAPKRRDGYPHVEGYRAWPVISAQASDWKVYILARDTEAPACAVDATVDANFKVTAHVHSRDDWADGTVAAAESEDLRAARVPGRDGTIEFQSPRTGAKPGQILVRAECVDAAGNRATASTSAVFIDPDDPCSQTVTSVAGAPETCEQDFSCGPWATLFEDGRSVISYRAAEAHYGEHRLVHGQFKVENRCRAATVTCFDATVQYPDGSVDRIALKDPRASDGLCFRVSAASASTGIPWRTNAGQGELRVTTDHVEIWRRDPVNAADNQRYDLVKLPPRVRQ